MKKIIFLSVSLVASLFSSAQDTVHYGDPWYLYRDGFSNIYDTVMTRPGAGDWLKYSKHAFATPDRQTDATLVYGVAVTFVSDIPTDSLFYSVGIYQMTNRWLGSNINPDDVSIATFATLDTATASDFTRRCKFGYILDTTDGVVELVEFYFNQPVSITTDTFYAGLNYIKPSFYPTKTRIARGVDTNYSQQWWYKNMMGDFILFHQNYPWHEGAWGIVFPIVKIRCTEPRVPVLEEERCDTLVLRFPDDGEEHVYEVAWAHINSMVDTNNAASIVTSTADGRVVLGGLQPGERYWYRARRSCTLATSGYSQTVWTPWGTGYYVPGRSGGLGIRELPQETSFDLHPNPAVGEVTLTGLQPGATLQIVDPQGRLHATHTVRQPQMTLDLGTLPRGLYLVRQTCATGTSTRKLAVER